MNTGSRDEQKYLHDIGDIARHLNRIANCMEAAEERARKVEETTPEDIVRAGEAIAAVRRGFASLEDPEGTQPKTRGELLKALGGDIKALQDPQVQHLLATLPDEYDLERRYQEEDAREEDVAADEYNTSPSEEGSTS